MNHLSANKRSLREPVFAERHQRFILSVESSHSALNLLTVFNISLRDRDMRTHTHVKTNNSKLVGHKRRDSGHVDTFRAELLMTVMVSP